MTPSQASNDSGQYSPISDYAAVGDCRTIGLVSRQESTDWLCLPSQSGPAVFCALLDRKRHAQFAICPITPYRTHQRYVPEANVLETVFETATGRVQLTDLTVVNGTGGTRLAPERELLRLIEGTDSDIRFEIICDLRPDLAEAPAERRWRGVG